MNLKKILELGYFPKELPPPFETKTFASKARYIKAKWNKLLTKEEAPKPGESSGDAKKRFREDYTLKYGSSQLLPFSLAKGNYSRRKLAIPNPKQFLDLSDSINDNWQLLKSTCSLSNYSQSSPVEKDASRSIRTKSRSWNEFKFELIENSFNKKVQLQLDISQFYPSIYTHSIPWSILGKEKSKYYFKISSTQKNTWASLLSTDADAKNYRIADFIDTLVRNCNERQSIGLPIGPDTSFILAECIGSRIDHEIEQKLNGIEHKAIRYYDDYYFYVMSIDDAEYVLKKVQQVLNEFQLETNESKVKVTTLPFEFTETWASEISSFRFQKVDKYQLRHFFSIFFKVLKENRMNTSWVVHYALGRFEYGHTRVPNVSWDIFLSYLLKILLIDPSNINQVFKIILSYKPFINNKSKEKIALILETIINDHLPLNHSFEVSWSLWIYKSLEIKCPREILTDVLSSNDSISKIVALDLISSGLYIGQKPALSELNKSLSGNDLFNSNWLITYEANKKKWLNFNGRNILIENEFMKILNDYDVEFYNTNNSLETHFIVGDDKPKAPSIPYPSSFVTNMIKKKPNSNFYDIFDELFDEVDSSDDDPYQ